MAIVPWRGLFSFVPDDDEVQEGDHLSPAAQHIGREFDRHNSSKAQRVERRI